MKIFFWEGIIKRYCRVVLNVISTRRFFGAHSLYKKHLVLLFPQTICEFSFQESISRLSSRLSVVVTMTSK